MIATPDLPSNPESFLAHMLKGLFRELVNPPPPIPRLTASQVVCHYCQAEPEQPCVTAGGVTKRNFHRDREKHAYIKATVDSGQCLNKLCNAGKVWTREKTIDCPECQGTGMTTPGFWSRFSPND